MSLESLIPEPDRPVWSKFLHTPASADFWMLPAFRFAFLTKAVSWGSERDNELSSFPLFKERDPL